MPTSGRHDAALRSATESCGATAVGASALPRLSTRALDAELARLDDELVRGVAERAEVERSIGVAEVDRAVAQSQLDSAESDLLERHAHRIRLESTVDAAQEDLQGAETRRAALDASLVLTDQRIASLDTIHSELDATLTAVTGRSLTREQVVGVADDLDRTAAMATTDAVATDTSTALSGWALELRHGTAALQPVAAELIAELDELEQQWDDHGRGDLMASPEVVSARSTLEDARRVQAEIEDLAFAGALGQRTIVAIRMANSRRTQLEDLGNKADEDELRAAIEAETEALHMVGFDSMLDLRIAMSTGGTGTLVDARRATIAARVTELESELATTLARTVALHAELQERVDTLRRRATDLVGTVDERPLDDMLRGMLAVPAAVGESHVRLTQSLQTVRAQVETQQGELRELAAAMPALDLRVTVAHAQATDVITSLEQTELAGTESAATLDALDASLTELRELMRSADAKVAASAAAADELAARPYLDDDVRELSDALLATLMEHATWLASGAGSLHGPRPSAMVVDDPLDDLRDADAAAVIDRMVSMSWPLPVQYVTSRPKIVRRLRHGSGDLRCVDGRRGARTPRRWLKRQDHDQSRTA